MGINFDDSQIIEFIKNAYQQNLEILRHETGAALTAEVKRAGLQQVLFYWEKMREIALNVSETEVRLSLPSQRTPKGREFGIEGVVDIVREDNKTIIYDIKTHEVDYVRSNIGEYEGQLNVYGHIWKELQNHPLDGTALICTDIPAHVKEAFESGDEARLKRALDDWDPLIEIEFDLNKVEETVKTFGEVVDQIEDKKFSPPRAERLFEPYSNLSNVRFGTHVCRNCDARFSCDAYRTYIRGGRGQSDSFLDSIFKNIEVGEPLEEWRTAGLDSSSSPEELY